MRVIAKKRPTGFYGLLSKKAVRIGILLGSLLLVSTTVNAVVIILGSKAV